ncbi:hypothetical protein ACWF9G_05320 [Nocardia sp. NPDC055029]|uniref:hypothetical protein n=1 Tax=Nocardia sp. NPDC060259 TaxID=3347088 RepID=UPI00365CEE1E
MRIHVNQSALKHGILEDEIRAIISYPALRYAVKSRTAPEAFVFVFVGRLENEPWLEVVAENVEDVSWEVFHAMRLTARVAAEVCALSGLELPTNVRQRPQRAHEAERRSSDGKA